MNRGLVRREDVVSIESALEYIRIQICAMLRTELHEPGVNRFPCTHFRTTKGVMLVIL